MTGLGRWAPLRPDEVSALLQDLRAPWWLSGGWSLDLLMGRETRDHGDTDVTILRSDADGVRRFLHGWDLHVADPPGIGTLRPWPTGSPLASELHDVWCRPSATEPWCLQFMINDAESGRWIYRRDHRIRRPIDSLAGRASTMAMAVLAPEVQLLYKSAHIRPKDDMDFRRMRPHLEVGERRWLFESLLVTAPGHRWIAALLDDEGPDRPGQE